MGLLVNGGGGVPKSRLRDAATAALNVLRGTFFVNSNGALAEGTMKDNQGQSVMASVVTGSSVSNVPIAVPERACYDANSTLHVAFSEFGSASPSDVVSSKTMTSVAGLLVNGTMADYSGQAKPASLVDKNGTNIRMKVANPGRYSTASYVISPASNFGDATAADVDSSVTFTSASGLNIQGTGKKVAVESGHSTAGTGGSTWSFNAVEDGIYVVCVQSIYTTASMRSGGELLVNRVSGGGYATRDTDGTIKSQGSVSLLVIRATATTVTLSIDAYTWAGSRMCWVRVA